jgi:hypothetical protein
MIGTSTNALIACLRALSNESSRLERLLKGGGLTDEKSEELGHYMMDLQESIAWVAEVYESHRTRDGTLTPVNELLAHFKRSEPL